MANTLLNIQGLWQRMSLFQRTILLALILGIAGVSVVLVNWARKPNMALLYSGLSVEEAGKVVEKIRDTGTPVELRDGGTTIFVPDDQVYSLRLSLAKDSLPAADQGGYRILDGEKFGASPFSQRINFIRAVEGELARTIQLLDGVLSARVHVVKPEAALFAGRDDEASATVMLRLKTGYRMSPGNVAAVVHLVSGAVEGLRPQKVVVVDSQGNLLSGEADDELAKKAGTFLDYKTQYEEYLARKAEDMLTKVLGPNRASVRVDAQVETSSVVQTTETYDPEKRVVIKEEQKSSSSTPGETKGEGSGGAMKEENNTNEYMASKTVEQRTDMPGKVRSLTVAAFVDLSAPPPGPDGKPLPAPSLTAKDVEEIIRNAMGLKPTDTIKVVSTSFYNPPVEVAKDDGGQSTKDLILEIARRSSLGLLVIGALIAMKMVRGKKSKVTAAEAAAALPGSASAAGFLPAGEETVNMNLDSLRQRITQALQENPEEVKRLFASWVNSEQGGA